MNVHLGLATSGYRSASFMPHSGARAPLRESMTVTVAAREALTVRKAVVVLAGCSIERCVPMHHEDKVMLEIRFPAGQGNAVIERVVACVAEGVFGRVQACVRPAVRSRAVLDPWALETWLARRGF
jgi:hypothetical protein